MSEQATGRKTRFLGRREFLRFGLAAGAAVFTEGVGAPGYTAVSKPSVIVGSKDFTEQLVCGELAATLLENAGYPVERKLRLGGTAICHEALISGKIDTYVEYTGTGLTAILKLPSVTDPNEAYEIVSKFYQSRFKVTWLKPWGFNDTYALMMRKDVAGKLGVRTISDLRQRADSLTLGATQEFLVRPDGLPGLEKAYGLRFKATRGMDFGLMYEAVSKGQVDVISGFATDGRVISLDLVLLRDDRHFFPPYYAAPVIRDAKLRQDPKIADVLNQLAGKIPDNVMANLNLLVDQNKEDPRTVARRFLTQLGLIK